MADTDVQRSAMEINKMQQDYNIMNIRLNPDKTLAQIESFLKGIRLQYQPDPKTGETISIPVYTGSTKANELGIHSILSWLTGIINPSVVQGNFPVDKHGYSHMYENYIDETQEDLCLELVTNCYDWEIKAEAIPGIISFIMRLVIPYMSRLIGDKERKSYSQSLESKETHVVGKGVPTFK